MYSHAMQRKIIIIVIAILLIVCLSSALFILSRPKVAFVTGSELPESYAISLPGNILRYRMVNNPGKADLVIVSPDAAMPPVPCYLFGRESEEGEEPLGVLIPEEGAMWSFAPAWPAAVVYERSSSAADDLADDIIQRDGSIKRITYNGRVSVANLESVESEIEKSGAEYVLMLTPETSLSLLRAERPWKAVLDERDAAALETTAAEYAVAIDWDGTIENLLSGTGELSYRLISL